VIDFAQSSADVLHLLTAPCQRSSLILNRKIGVGRGDVIMRLREIIAGFVPFTGQLEYPLHLFGRPFGFTCGDKGLPIVEALHQLEISFHTLTPLDLRNIQ